MKIIFTIILNLIYSLIFAQTYQQGVEQKNNPFNQNNYQSELDISTSNDSKIILKNTSLENGSLLVQQTDYWWDGLTLVPNYNYEHKYDNYNNEIEYLAQKWDDSIWVDSYRLIKDYDSKNNLVELLDQSRFNSWVSNSKKEFKYNPNNNLVETVTKFHSITGWEINNSSQRFTFNYDNKGNMIEKSQYQWNGTDWQIHFNITYGYLNMNLLEEYRLKWDGSKLISDWYVSHSYDERDNLIESYITYGNSITWGLKKKNVYKYDENNNLIEFIILERDSTDWYNSWQENSYYDQNNNLIEKIKQVSNDAHELVYDIRWIYDYDDNNNQTAIFTDYWKNLDWFTYGYRRLRYILPTGIVLKQNETQRYELFSNYPNPFNPTTKISYSIPGQSDVIVRIFDVLGRLVSTLVNKKQPQGNYEVEFDGSELTSGLYFYRLQAGDFVETKKMILLK